MLDEHLNAYLLEVNHNPSLKCDAHIDQKVKEPLVIDTLRLLGFTAKRKRKLVQMKKRFVREKSVMGRRYNSDKEAMKVTCLEEKDEFMMKNKGTFERIFPPETQNIKELNENYELFIKKATSNCPAAIRNQSYWDYSRISLLGKKSHLFSEFNRDLSKYRH